ncbi:UNVERIFIED_CONTAM: Cytosolic sulfotransferase 14 [Sesamum latifolium]|uniref:Sulfotransferase n=1 Tax=Sesamum latifolium TaxID=2727402 RepID=A0AAW2X5J4_9LAMI
MLSAQNNFRAKATDVILSTMPKSGTTWLKALTFSIANRNVFPIDQTPLLTSTPHMLVPFLEFNVYWRKKLLILTIFPVREFSQLTCLSKSFLIPSVKVTAELSTSAETHWIRNSSMRPLLDHMLGYWNAHLDNPGKVLFLKYEDLKEDITSQVKKIAEFMRFPFSQEEEEQGLIDQISGLCSFESLSNLAVNKTGNINGIVKNSSFFRKGQVGDWTNYMTPSMVERVQKLMDSKFENSGLIFKT